MSPDTELSRQKVSEVHPPAPTAAMHLTAIIPLTVAMFLMAPRGIQTPKRRDIHWHLSSVRCHRPPEKRAGYPPSQAVVRGLGLI
jgi:hypothetical protein